MLLFTVILAEDTVSCGGVISADCIEGYYSNTLPSSLTCDQGGTWSGEVPSVWCSPITCPPPATNATVNSTGNMRRGVLNTPDYLLGLMIGIWASLGLDFATFLILYPTLEEESISMSKF